MWFGLTNVVATLYTIDYGNVLELKVPLSLFGSPSAVFTSSFVVAVENGEPKPVKWFDGSFRVKGD